MYRTCSCTSSRIAVTQHWNIDNKNDSIFHQSAIEYSFVKWEMNERKRMWWCTGNAYLTRVRGPSDVNADRPCKACHWSCPRKVQKWGAAMISTKVLTNFLGKACQDGVSEAFLVDAAGGVLGVGKAQGIVSKVSTLLCSGSRLSISNCLLVRS